VSEREDGSVRQDGEPVERRPSRQELWDERHASRDPIEARDADPTLIEEIGKLAPGTALDLGAGDGRNAVWLAAHGWRVTAVDFSRVALDRGRAFASSAGVEVEWLLADLLEWSPPTEAFDLVALFFIHLPPRERRPVYARAAAAVASGGTLLVVAHDRSNLVDGVGGPQDPTVLFTPDEIAGELPDDFTVVRAEVARRAAPTGPGPLDAIVRAVRRRPGGESQSGV
jgi:SAM-dependent methyltransferase